MATKTEIINIIIDIKHFQGLECTEEEAENEIEYSIKHGILYTEEDYKKHFAPYEN